MRGSITTYPPAKFIRHLQPLPAVYGMTMDVAYGSHSTRIIRLSVSTRAWTLGLPYRNIRSGRMKVRSNAFSSQENAFTVPPESKTLWMTTNRQ